METQPLSEDAFQLLVASVTEYAIFMLDPTGHVESWNAGAERIKGYKANEIIGRHFSTFFIEDDLKDGKPARELEIARIKGQYQEEGWRVRKDGSRFWASIVITALFGADGTLRGFGKVTRDMTQWRLAEQELRATNEKLIASNRELELFATVASHDLQEPLRKIQTFGHQLAAEYSDGLGAEGRFCLQRIEDAASRMRYLIDDLLTYARISRQDRSFVPVDLASVASEVLGDLAGRIQSVDGQVEIGDLPVIAADPVQMHQLLQNLIGNALKFHQPDRPPHVWVSARRLGTVETPSQPDHGVNMLELSVRDNGIGFEDQYREKIFGVFQRLHGRGDFEGTGMGLAICRKIVERHGGHIEAYGRPDEGSEFLATLPISHSENGFHSTT